MLFPPAETKIQILPCGWRVFYVYLPKFVYFSSESEGFDSPRLHHLTLSELHR